MLNINVVNYFYVQKINLIYFKESRTILLKGDSYDQRVWETGI